MDQHALRAFHREIGAADPVHQALLLRERAPIGGAPDLVGDRAQFVARQQRRERLGAGQRLGRI
ncbi:MAG: hypothetical protein ABW032_04355, partial [Burkholderiaceae bacterium]